MFAAFPVVRQLHELLWYLTEARSLDAAAPLHGDLTRALAEVDEAAGADAAALAALDVGPLREAVDALLLRTSELVRASGGGGGGGGSGGSGSGGSGSGGSGGGRAGSGRAGAGRVPKALRRVRRGADLVGADLRGADLRGRDLRGAYLLGADLRQADLRSADLIGADLRGADVRGADLRGALFLTQFQLNATRGDAGTRIPPPLTRPAHWTR